MNRKKIGFNLGTLKISGNSTNNRDAERNEAQNNTSNSSTETGSFGSFGKYTMN